MPTTPLESETTILGRQPDEFRLREFQELRATIRERGHVRVIVSFLTFVSWAALTIGVIAEPLPPLVLVPLLVLAAGFEIVYAVHVGVERLGRYVFVFYEGPDEMPKWETAIAAFGRTEAATATGGSALFVPLFVLAALANLGVSSLVLLGRSQDNSAPALLAAAIVHALFLARVFIARSRAGRQRAVDTEAFRSIAAELGQTKHTKSN